MPVGFETEASLAKRKGRFKKRGTIQNANDVRVFSHSHTYMCIYIYAFLYIFFTSRKHMIIQYVFSYVHRFIDIHIIISMNMGAFVFCASNIHLHSHIYM